MINKHKPQIVIVDDDRILPAIVKQSTVMENFDVIGFSSGIQALDNLDSINPDLFLLDISMPQMSGIELCDKLKGVDKYKDIPVIFLTGLNETDKIVDAFKKGATDYILKPVIMEELSARINTHIDLYNARKKLKHFASEMEELADQRAKQLVHADRLATIGRLYAELAHEIKNPATFISGNIQTLEMFWPILKSSLFYTLNECEDCDKEKIRFIIDEIPKMISSVRSGISGITRVVDNFKSYSRKQEFEISEFSINESIQISETICEKIFKGGIKLEKDIQSDIICCKGDKHQLAQVFTNLFVNAADAMIETKDPKIIIKVFTADSNCFIDINDNGPGMSNEKIKDIFNPFFTTKPLGKGTGLGLSICKSIIEQLKGSIHADLNELGGMSFKIMLPIFNKE